MKKRLTVTEIVEAVYCEQKVLFDREFGVKRTAEQKKNISYGSKKHASFEVAGYIDSPKQFIKAVDKRCYIATHLYGVDSWEANHLRAMRDDHLMSNKVGASLVRLYYYLSPGLIGLFGRYYIFNKVAKSFVEFIIKCTRKQ